MAQSKPHIILIAYYFPPMNAIGGVRPFRFYKYLKQFGYTCDVLTAAEQKPGGEPDIRFIPDTTAAVWAGEQSGPAFSFDLAIERVIRRFVLPGHTGIAWSRTVASECRRLQRHYRDRKAVLFSTYPPTGAHLAALQVALTSRIPWIADFRDPMAIAAGVEDRSKLFQWTLSQMEAKTFERASALIANVETAASIWRERYPSAKDKLHVICNGFDPQRQPRARPTKPGNRRAILHAGSLYAGRNANAVIHSLARLREKDVPGADSVCIQLVGPVGAGAEVDEDAYSRAGRQGWLEQVRENVPQEQAQRMTEEAHGLLLLQPQSKVQVPGKLFEYICIGRPVLAVAPRESAIEQILSRAGIPYVCIHPDDPAEVADQKMLEYLALPVTAETPSGWFQENFNVENQTRQLCSILDGLV